MIESDISENLKIKFLLFVVGDAEVGSTTTGFVILGLASFELGLISGVCKAGHGSFLQFIFVFPVKK